MCTPPHGDNPACRGLSSCCQSFDFPTRICQRLNADGLAANPLGAPGAIRAKTSLDSPSSSGAVITHLSYQLSLKSWNARCNLLKTKSWNLLETENRLLENEMHLQNLRYMLQFHYSFPGMPSCSSETSKSWPSCDYHGSLHETKSVWKRNSSRHLDASCLDQE